MMKVAIDLTPLYSAHQYRGIGFYTKRLVEALKPLVKKRKIILKFAQSREALIAAKPKLIHYPYFTPYFLSLPPRPLAPTVVSIHDLIPVKYQKHFPPGIKGRIGWLIQKKRLKKVEAVITDSKFWQKEISLLTGYPKKNIFPIFLAAGFEFKKIGNLAKLNSIQKKYRLPARFVLYVGDVNWNKNVLGLIEGCQGAKLPLVIVGKQAKSRDFDRKHLENQPLVELLKRYGKDPKVRRLGFVPTNDLVVLYNLASVYCQPSFSEGFGLGVLEAMSCGCPVVTSGGGSLSEVAGSAAILVDPYDINSIARGIKRALKQKKLLVKKGLQQSKKFSWEKTALKTVAVYEKILAKT